MTEYVYRGDKFTDSSLKGAGCNAVRRPDGKCIRGRNGNMLCDFGGLRAIVLARQLRKTKQGNFA